MRSLLTLAHRWVSLAVVVGLMLALVPSALADDPPRQGETPPDAYNVDPANSHVSNATVIDSLGLDPAAVSSLSFGTSDHNGFNVFTTAASGFPTQGNSYFVMSSGCTSVALSANVSGSTSCVLAGLNQSQGNDLVRMTLVLNVPAGAQSWVVDWKFFSEEFPEWVGTPFNDAFLIEVGSSNFTISGISNISAPNNVAFDANGNPITINTTGALGMNSANAAGTTYDGATTTLATHAPVPSGATTLTLIFSVMDLGDSIFDTTVFIDNIRFSTNPVGGPITEPVINQPPAVDAGGPYPVNEGGSVVVMATGSDPNGDPLTYAWDLDNNGAFETPGQSATFSAATLDGPSSHTVAVRATDSGGLSATDSATVNVLNVAPTATLTDDGPVNEGSPFTLSLINPSDPSGADTAAGFTYAFDCGSGYGSFSSNNSATCATTDNSTPTVRGKIRDKDGGETEYTGMVTINNIAPTLTIVAPTGGALYAVNTAVNLSASFTDPATADTHTCTINWDDGAGAQAGIVNETAGSGTCTGNKSFASAGVYNLVVTVGDDDGGSDTESVMVVVYDPSAGFVTGGGWIDSPSGAYTPDDPTDPDITGRANFGFVSKYQKGATVPTGVTQFQFKVANLNFHSNSYEWLVVAGARAQYKGAGTINGAGDYGFMLTAIDGQINGGGGGDKFRIKIWDKATGTVVYDNQVGAADDATPTTILGGGSIVIHSGQ